MSMPAVLTRLLAPGVIGLAALAGPVAAQAGDSFHADYGPLGSIAFRFV